LDHDNLTFGEIVCYGPLVNFILFMHFQFPWAFFLRNKFIKQKIFKNFYTSFSNTEKEDYLLTDSITILNGLI